MTHGGETLWYTRCPMPTASSVAISDGWLERAFEPDGIAVRSLRALPGQHDRLAHYSHDHEALFREGGIVPPMWAFAAGARTRLIAIGWEEQFRALIGGPGSGVVEPGDLRGRRVALPRQIGEPIDFARALAWHGITGCLAAVGIDEHEVQFVDVATDEPNLTGEPPETGPTDSVYTAKETIRAQRAELLALVRGEVDAIYVAGGYGLEIAELIGAPIIVELSCRDPWPEWSGNHLRVLTVSEELLVRRPDLVGRYVDTLQQAASWAAHHEGDATRIIAVELGLPEEWVSRGYHPRTAQHLQLEISERALEALEERADFLYRRGFLAAPVDLGRWLEPSVLAASAVVPDR